MDMDLPPTASSARSNIADTHLPPPWRVRKIGDRWTVLRLQPIRHEVYFPVKTLGTAQEAWEWICVRTGNCPIPDDFDGVPDPAFRKAVLHLLMDEHDHEAPVLRVWPYGALVNPSNPREVDLEELPEHP